MLTKHTVALKASAVNAGNKCEPTKAVKAIVIHAYINCDELQDR